jgi:acetyl esterase/lipase
MKITPSISMTPILFDETTLAEARRFNRNLAWAPRFKIRNRFTPLVIQSLLRLSQIGGTKKLERQGLAVEQRRIAIDGMQAAVRIIRPPGPVQGVIFDVHGGGWVIGNAQMDDAANAAMAVHCSVAVVSIDYRLFGHTPIQGLMTDVLTAARWLLGGGLPEYTGLPVIFVGESAGGHLAAATLLQLKAWPELLRRVKGAVLYYGVYDLLGTSSVRKAGPDTLVLDGPGMAPALRMLTPDLSDAERQQAPLSPLYGDFEDLPPALMFVGLLDPLRDDTLEITKRWAKHANVETHLVPDAPHGFIHFPIRMAEQTLAYSRQWIRRCIENPLSTPLC